LKTPPLVVIFVLLDDHVVAFASDDDFLGGLIAGVEAFGKRSP